MGSDERDWDALLGCHDLSDLDTDLNAPEPEPDPVPRFRMRVLLVDPAPAFDKEAEREKIMSSEIAKALHRANRAFDAIGHLARLCEYRGRVVFECRDEKAFESIDQTVFDELAMGLAALFYDLDPPCDHMGSKVQGMRRYADAIHDLLAERANRAVMSAEVKARARSPFEAVKDDTTRKLLQGAVGELPVLGPETADQVDEVFAEVHAQAGWFSAATAELWRSVRHEVQEGRPPWFRPVLLLGEPGVGKTTLGRIIASEFGVPLVEVDAGSGGAAFSVAGVEKGWGSASLGRPVEAIARYRVANPVVLVNEIDRIGGLTSTSGSRTSLNDAMLPLLDPASASRWTCPASRIEFDMSKVLWVLTSNSINGVDPALLSRCRIFTVPRPSPEHVAKLVRDRLHDLDLDLAAEASEMVAREWSGRSITLRHVDAMVDRIKRALTGPRLH